MSIRDINRILSASNPVVLISRVRRRMVRKIVRESKLEFEERYGESADSQYELSAGVILVNSPRAKVIINATMATMYSQLKQMEVAAVSAQILASVRLDHGAAISMEVVLDADGRIEFMCPVDIRRIIDSHMLPYMTSDPGLANVFGYGAAR
jgi:hypothetical protein